MAVTVATVAGSDPSSATRQGQSDGGDPVKTTIDQTISESIPDPGCRYSIFYFFLILSFRTATGNVAHDGLPAQSLDYALDEQQIKFANLSAFVCNVRLGDLP